MKPQYTELGFNKPKYLENRFGIKIHLGTTGKDDWAVEIPKKLMGDKYEKYCDENFTIYMITEECALSVARKYTLKEKLKETEGYNM